MQNQPVVLVIEGLSARRRLSSILVKSEFSSLKCKSTPQALAHKKLNDFIKIVCTFINAHLGGCYLEYQSAWMIIVLVVMKLNLHSKKRCVFMHACSVSHHFHCVVLTHYAWYTHI